MPLSRRQIVLLSAAAVLAMSADYMQRRGLLRFEYPVLVVLAAIGMDEQAAAGSLRMTLGRPTTADDIDAAAETIIRVVAAEYGRLGIQP